MDLEDILTSPDCLSMSAAQFGAYHLLLYASWLHDDCSIPCQDAQLSILSRMGSSWASDGGLVRDKFFEKDGRLYNKRLLEERKSIKAFRKKQSSNALEGQRQRREKVAREEVRGGPPEGISTLVEAAVDGHGEDMLRCLERQVGAQSFAMQESRYRKAVDEYPDIVRGILDYMIKCADPAQRQAKDLGKLKNPAGYFWASMAKELQR